MPRPRQGKTGGPSCVKKREIFHGFSRFFTFYHLDQARNYAIFTLSRVRPIFDKEARK